MHMHGSMHVCLKLWFSGSKIEQTITTTSQFLVDIGKVPNQRTGAFGTAINRTYLDAALQFLPSVDLQKLLRDDVHFALLIPFSGAWDVGSRIAGAAALAVEKVNTDKALLPGRQLEYSWADSGCSAKQGLKAMGELLAHQSRISAVIGLQLSVRGDEPPVRRAGRSPDQLWL